MISHDQEFYIGWLPSAPNGISRHIRRAVWVAGILLIILAGVVVLFQRGFDTSTFEFGTPTEVSGVLVLRPVPLLQVYRGQDIQDQPIYQHILLVGAGKHGVRDLLHAFEAKTGKSPEGMELHLKGFLIYYDGKTLLEIEDVSDLKAIGPGEIHQPAVVGSRGMITGEITDPKCLFGVMKPGSGKPHRSCSARCIAGGIPPVLKTLMADGTIQFYLLEGADPDVLASQVIPYAGDEVAICGEISSIGEWKVLRPDPARTIQLVRRGPMEATAICR